MVNSPAIVVTADSDAASVLQAAHQLARELGLAFERSVKLQGTDFVLALGDQRLELRDGQTRPGRGLFVDFSSLISKSRGSHRGFSRNQPLARAVGKAASTVLDATAGLGHDAALLACMGYRVVAVERSPIIASLLRDGLNRALEIEELRDHLGDRLEIINADACDVLRARRFTFDAAYIDPMFPPKRKASALAKKSIRMVRQLVGEDADAGDLFAAARQVAKRVVVKRPTYAKPLADKPSISFTGKLVRYDVYLGPVPDSPLSASPRREMSPRSR